MFSLPHFETSCLLVHFLARRSFQIYIEISSNLKTGLSTSSISVVKIWITQRNLPVMDHVSLSHLMIFRALKLYIRFNSKEHPSTALAVFI